MGAIISGLGVQTGGAFLSQGVNNPTWYISVLLICYTALYFTTWLAARLQAGKQWLYVAMVFLGAGALTYNFNYPFLNYHSARGYTAFFTGVILSMVLERVPVHRTTKGLLGSLSILLGFCLLFFTAYAAIQNDMRFLPIFVEWSALIIFLKTPVCASLFSCKLWGTLSSISFNAYVWHSVLIKLNTTLCLLLDTQVSATRYWMILFTIFCFAVGTASHYLLEKPLANMLDHLRESVSRQEVHTAE